jgi:xanthine dehydrogenase accessory factor
MKAEAQQLPHAASHDDWFEPLHEWPRAAARTLQAQGSVARVVVASVLGSAPRAAGTCMLIDDSRTLGTIGGGRLEEVAVMQARTLLDPSLPAARIERLILGTELAQCCGGVVELWIERYTRADVPMLLEAARLMRTTRASLTSVLDQDRVSHRASVERFADAGRVRYTKGTDGIITLWERLDEPLPQLWLYGAGHVGQAVARVVTTLPMHLTWIDSRPGLPPAPRPENIDALSTTDPVATVAAAPAGTHFLIMTHSHALDYELCRAILERRDAPWVGLIGSDSKAARFRSRLRNDAVTDRALEKLACPIGIDGINSKRPEVIAIAVAAQLLQLLDTPAQAATDGATGCDGDCNRCGTARVS